MAQNATMPHTPRRYRRLAKQAIAAALLLWFARFAYLRITLKPTPRPEYWAAKIAALDPPPPNATPVETITKLLEVRPFELPTSIEETEEISRFDSRDAALTGTWNASRRDIQKALAIVNSKDFNSRRLQLIEATAPGWQYKDKLDPDERSPLHNLNQWAKWLLLHARWSIETNSDARSAVADWTCIATLARQVQRTGMIWNHLIAAGNLARLGDELSFIARETRVPIDVHDLALRLDSAVGQPASAFTVLQGDRAYLHAWLDRIYVREGGDWLAVNTAVWESRAFFYELEVKHPPYSTWNLLSPLFHDYPTAVSRLDGQIDAYVHCDDMVSAHKTQFSFPRSSCIDVRDGIYYPNTGPGDSLALYYRYCTQFEAGLSLLAIREFKRKTGAPPNALSELVPDYLPRLPLDYADRKPLRYKRNGSDFRLYSVGFDGIDQNGEGSKLDHNDWPESSDFRFDNRTRPAARSR